MPARRATRSSTWPATAWSTRRAAASTGRPTPIPANHVSLRSVGWDNFVIIDVATRQDRSPSSTGAPRTRCCTSRPSTSTTASSTRSSGSTTRTTRPSCARSKPDYFTDRADLPHRRRCIEAAAARAGRSAARGIGWGDVKVVEKVIGYKKIKFYTHENAGYGDVRLPEMQMHTTAFWLTVPEDVAEMDRDSTCRGRGHRRAARGRHRARDGGDARADVRPARPRADARRRRRRERRRLACRDATPIAAAPAASTRRCFFSTRTPAASASPSASTSAPRSSFGAAAALIAGCPCDGRLPRLRRPGVRPRDAKRLALAADLET